MGSIVKVNGLMYKNSLVFLTCFVPGALKKVPAPLNIAEHELNYFAVGKLV